MEELLNFLNSIYPLHSDTNDYLIQTLKFIEIPKKEFILRQGHICYSIYFIVQGLVRCFYIKKEKEVSSWFMKEGDVMISVESFFNQSISYESIQALEDCILYYITYDELQDVYKKFPEFNIVGRIVTEKYYQLSEQRLYSLRMQRATDRYSYLMTNHAALIQRVPSKYLASYLGVTEETLSRIRAHK